MTREQLLALGYTEEQVNQIMSLHGQATQSLRATVGQHEATINTLNGQLSELQNQQQTQTEPTPPENPELAEAQKQIADLRAEMNRKDIAVYASAKGLTGEQAENVLKAFGTDVELAKSAIDSISQIISDSNKTAIADFEKQNLQTTPNPDGTTGNGGVDDTPADLKNAEGITFGGLSENAQTARDYYK